MLGGEPFSIDSRWASADRFRRSLIESSQMIAELIEIAKEMPEAM